MEHNIPTYLVNLPYHVPGLSSVDENGELMVYLNARLTSTQHQRTFEHELNHYARDDFHNGDPIGLAEARADTKAPPKQPVQKEPPAEQQKVRLPSARARYLQARFDGTRAKLPQELQAAMDRLFSQRINTVDEMYSRGFLLYGLRKESACWKQILLTYTIYGVDLPHRLPKDVARVTGTNIAHETMKRVLYALVEAV